MNKSRIALFIDVDNMALNKQHVDDVINRLEEDGEIVFARLYGVTDRRHRDIICEAVARGFEIVPPINPQKRGSSKVFDNRILVDLCELVFTNTSIDAVAIVANPANLVHLFSKLKKEDIFIYACDTLDSDSLHFADEVLHVAYQLVSPAKPMQKKRPESVKEEAQKVEPSAEEENEPEEEVVKAEEQAEEQAAEQKDESSNDAGLFEQMQQLQDVEPSADDDEDAELMNKIKKLLDEFN